MEEGEVVGEEEERGEQQRLEVEEGGEAVAEEEERGDAGEQLREGVEKEKDEKKRVLRRHISLKQKRHSVRGRSLVATHAFVPTHDDELALIEGETCVVLRCE